MICFDLAIVNKDFDHNQDKTPSQCGNLTILKDRNGKKEKTLIEPVSRNNVISYLIDYLKTPVYNTSSVKIDDIYP